MLPINVSEDKLELLANALSCLKGSLPFTYLDLLLSTTKPSVADFWPLVSKCERRLTTFSSFLSETRRLEMTNAALSNLSTFAMCTFLLPKTMIK